MRDKYNYNYKQELESLCGSNIWVRLDTKEQVISKSPKIKFKLN